MRRLGSALLIIALTFVGENVFAQKKQTYKSNGTTYYSNETYSTTGKPKVDRSSKVKTEFLKSRGYKKVPSGYQIDHIVPLSEGGADVFSNMQLLPIDQHKRKTANERAENSTSSTYRKPTYRSNSTYKKSDIYSTQSYSSGSGKTIYSGSKGGKYYINSNGNKTYIRKK